MRKIIIAISAGAIIAATTAVFHATQSFSKVFARAERHLALGQYRQALPYLTAAFAVNPQSLAAGRRLVEVYERLGNRQGVVSTLDVMAAHNPDDMPTLIYRADTAYALTDYPKAVSLYQKVYAREPNLETGRKLAEVLAWQEKYPEAAVLLEGLIAQAPGYGGLIELLADVYSWQRRYDKAEVLYRQLLAQDSARNDIALKLADILRYAGKNGEALRVYDHYLQPGK